LAAIINAIEGTLRKVPDTPIAERARAIQHYLEAEMLWREHDREGALRAAQASVDLVTPLVNDRHDDRRARDQRDLAVFCLKKADILKELAFGKSDPRYERDALAAYDESRRHAALARGDPQALRIEWYCDCMTADLLLTMYKETGDPEQQKRDLEGAATASSSALELAQGAVGRNHDEQSQTDLRVSEEIASRVRDAQKTGAERQGASAGGVTGSAG
jgi:hypothetical protein